ncbi:phage tail protein [Streptomyces sp. NPDC000941]
MKGAKATKPAAKEDRATPTQRTPEAAAPPEQTPGLTPSHLHRLQRMAGNAAVSRLVAQRYTAPVKPPPSQAPGFRKVQSDVAAKKQKLSQHNPAANESQSAQDAAVAPPDDKEAQGKAANAEKMNDAKPGEFNKAAFIEAVNKAIADQAPKNLDEADKFSGSGKAEKIKGEVDGKVTDGKNASSKDIETTTKAAPDTSQAKEKEVTPMKPDQPPANPGAPNAADATPQQQPPEVTDFSEGPKKTDQQMADAEVTEEQLAKSNEPEFTDALGEKKKAEQHSAQAPAQARGAEKQQLTTAKSNAAAAGTQAMATLTATRAGAGKQVDGGKGETKSKDEQKREQVTAKLQKVFDAAQKDVEGILSGLDGKVDKQFEEGEKKARDAFNKDQKRRMKQYKDKRYGGFWGPAKWAKDKIAGMPEEANQLFQESRKLYVNMMQGVISSIADTIGTELGKAKARIAQGRADIKTEVDKLPADLKQYGQEAAKDFAGKFDDLESEVNDKSQQLVQTLAQKYTQALNAVDEEIKKLQEANKGLVQKAVDAVVGVIKTIKELKDLLMGILAKAASAIMKIIKDPIGFLGNLVRAVGAGLQQFISNIGTHLQTGLVSWLLGTSAKAGIEIPSKFDLKGIIQLIASLLGLTWANIRARITRKGVPDQAMSAAEQSVPVAKALATEGPAGAAKEITAETGDLKSTILDDLKSYLIPTVIIAGITWILSLLNPASAFVRAVKGIIDIVSFIVNQGAQIVEFVNAVLDAVIAIANGGSAGVPKMVETALAASIPLLIGLLASLLGIGGLANKIKQVFQKVSRPVNRAIDKIAAKIAQIGKRIWAKLKGQDKKGDEAKNGDGRDGQRDIFTDVVHDVKSSLGKSPSADKAATVAESAFGRYQSHGLKLLQFAPKKERPGEFEVLIRASPLRRALVFRVSDLQLSFPRTACIVHVTDPSGEQENLGKFLVQRKAPGSDEGDTSHHAEQHMIGILRSRYFTGDRTKGKYKLQLSLTRRPCQGCGPALEEFKNELQGKGYDVDFTIRIVSSYAAEGEGIAINVLKSLNDKGFELEVLGLEKIVAEKLLGDPREKLSPKDEQILADEKNRVDEYLDKAGAKKGS